MTSLASGGLHRRSNSNVVQSIFSGADQIAGLSAEEVKAAILKKQGRRLKGQLHGGDSGNGSPVSAKRSS